MIAVAFALGGAALPAAADGDPETVLGVITPVDAPASARVPVILTGWHVGERGPNQVAFTVPSETTDGGAYRFDDIAAHGEAAFYTVTAGPTSDGRYGPTHATQVSFVDGVANVNVTMLYSSSISGAVVESVGGSGLDGIPVIVRSTDSADGTSVTTDANGEFTLLVAPGLYQVAPDVATLAYYPVEPVTVPITDDQHVSGIDFRLDRKAVIHGTVTTASAPQIAIPGIEVEGFGMKAMTDGDGHFSLTPPHEGAGSLRFRDPSGVFASITGPSVNVVRNSDVVYDQRMQLSATVSGTVLRSDVSPGPPTPLAGANVSVYQVGTDWQHKTVKTDAAGKFIATGLTPGKDYIVAYSSPGFVTSYWDRQATSERATRFRLSAGQTLTDMDALTHTQYSLASLSGVVKLAGEPATPASSAKVTLMHTDGSVFDVTTADPEGLYSFANVPPGEYLIRFTPAATDSAFQGVYLGGTSDPNSARIETVEPSTSQTGLDQTLPSQKEAVQVSRIGGTDRYAAAINVSRESFPSGADTVYVVTGANYPDALSAGPAAISDEAPLLLTLPTLLRSDVAEEIERLGATRIIVVGGVNSVSEAVFSQLAAMVPETTRITGADRYETSRLLAAAAFDTPTVVYIATGRDFPDALSAGAVAGAAKAPVLLIDGKASSLGQATQQTLDDLQPEMIVVAGGPSSVTAGLKTQLHAFAWTNRLSGTDRYGTSVRLNTSAIKTSAEAFLVTGSNFPDALTGAPWAGSILAPLYVSPTDCIPRATLSAMSSQGVSSLTLIGGENSLSPKVAQLTPC